MSTEKPFSHFYLFICYVYHFVYYFVEKLGSCIIIFSNVFKSRWLCALSGSEAMCFISLNPSCSGAMVEITMDMSQSISCSCLAHFSTLSKGMKIQASYWYLGQVDQVCCLLFAAFLMLTFSLFCLATGVCLGQVGKGLAVREARSEEEPGSRSWCLPTLACKIFGLD